MKNGEVKHMNMSTSLWMHHPPINLDLLPLSILLFPKIMISKELHHMNLEQFNVINKYNSETIHVTQASHACQKNFGSNQECLINWVHCGL